MADLELDRRRFIAGALSLPAAALLAGCGGDDSPAPAPSPVRAGGTASWEDVRALFELDPDTAHLSAYILAPHSRPVREAIERHRAGMDRDPRSYLLENEALEEEVAQAAASHLGTSPGLVAITTSTTMGLGLVFGGLRLDAGEDIVVTVHDHFVAQRSAENAADRAGATVRSVELFPPDAPERATTQRIVSRYREAIGPATRAVVVTWVQSSTGVVLPLREIAEVVERANRGRAEEERVLLVVDAAHALGGVPAPVEELGIDFLIAGCHKWLLGPRGTGIVWGTRSAWRRIAPMFASFRGSDPEDPAGARMTLGGYHAFEHRWALKEAFELHGAIGGGRIVERVGQLGDGLRDGLSGIRGVTVHTPRDRSLRSGVVAFTVDGQAGDETVRRLADRGIHASVGPYSVPLARLGAHWVNTETEVTAAVRAVEAIL